MPYAVGLILFAIGLPVGGLAPSMLVLVAARFVQGLGAGTLQPIAYVAIGRTLPEALRPRMFAVLSTAWVLPGVIGTGHRGHGRREHRLADRLPRSSSAPGLAGVLLTLGGAAPRRPPRSTQTIRPRRLGAAGFRWPSRSPSGPGC